MSNRILTIIWIIGAIAHGWNAMEQINLFYAGISGLSIGIAFSIMMWRPHD